MPRTNRWQYSKSDSARSATVSSLANKKIQCTVAATATSWPTNGSLIWWLRSSHVRIRRTVHPEWSKAWSTVCWRKDGGFSNELGFLGIMMWNIGWFNSAWLVWNVSCISSHGIQYDFCSANSSADLVWKLTLLNRCIWAIPVSNSWTFSLSLL